MVDPLADGSDGADVRARPLAEMRFFASWSGGKDAYLALQRGVAAGGRPGALLCMLEEGGSRSRGHGLSLATLHAQADALGLPLVTRATSWDDYEDAFLDALDELRSKGVEAGVFGDIDLEPHREWVERVCAARGFAPRLPLWREPRRVLLDELLGHGVRATIVVVRADRLDASFLGRVLDHALIDALEAARVDACGEEGEYHTMVTDAPLFSDPVALDAARVVARDDCFVLDFQTITGTAAAAPSVPSEKGHA
jgi:diphthine-ammonia ligase